jgi:hypothetical protein
MGLGELRPSVKPVGSQPDRCTCKVYLRLQERSYQQLKNQGFLFYRENGWGTRTLSHSLGECRQPSFRVAWPCAVANVSANLGTDVSAQKKLVVARIK